MKRTLLLVGLGIVLSLGALTTAAEAQATRTWVSGVGDDANPCSRTAPCKTWAGAISKTADCGEIDALDPGGFGAVTITKGITLDGGGGESGMVSSILVAAGPAITINNSSPSCTLVVIRNMDITGIQAGSNGINYLQGGSLSVENVHIGHFTGFCIEADAPSVKTSIRIYNTGMENCTGGGIHSSYGGPGVSRISIERSVIMRMGAYGVNANNNTDLSIHNSMIAGNVNGGVLADSASALVSLDMCTVTNNQAYGVHSTNGATIRMSNTSVNFTNGTGLLADAGGQILTWQNNWVGGNAIDGARTGTILPQ